MYDSDQKALRRAALLLLLVSFARWGIAARRDSAVESQGRVVAAVGRFDDHVEATSAAVEEEKRRSRPLTEGERLDPNVADEVELDRLPGVGPATARAVMAARDSGVVFRRPEDLLQVRGIGPASLERIEPFLDLPGGGAPARRRLAPGPGSSRTATAVPVDVNRADAATLETLPGIGPAIAGRIVEERRAGFFASLDDLQRVKGIGPATVERLRGRALAGSVR